jgi:3-methyladenine DNA glycosylase AlkD
MVSVKDVLDILWKVAKPEHLEEMTKYGIRREQRLCISIPDLRKLAKEIGIDHELAMGLWRTGIGEARILAAMIDDPDKLTEERMEDWVKDIDAWDICDQVCMDLFRKNQLAWKKILDWSKREEEFVKRTAFSLIACLAWHDKKAADGKFLELLPIIVSEATDERNFVKKAVNWALRNIGKRNPNLNKAAINTAKKIQQLDSRAARWIASDAIRELESNAVQNRLRK